MKIAIIGGGLSGSLVTINLIKQATGASTIYLFEKTQGQLNKGVAYSSQLPYQLLNVPVNEMSLFLDKPMHFCEWLKEKGYNYQPADFATRDLYGKYVAESFANETAKQSRVEVKVVLSEVTNIERCDGGYRLVDDMGEKVEVDKIILCTGNLPPGDVPGLPQAIKNNIAYVSHPWDGFDVNSLSSRENILMVGSGLTMLDLVLSLNYNDHIGKITVISRRGLLPLPHGTSLPYKLSHVPEDGLNISTLLTWFKNEVKLAEQEGKDWRSAVNAIRPYIQNLWSRLPLEEKKRFMRHLRPFWEIHRHKMPLESQAILNRMKQDGRLEIIAGRIKNAEALENTIKVTYHTRNSSARKQVAVNRIINCTGPETEYRKLRSALYQSLIENKLVQANELSLGLNSTSEGFIIDAEGKVNYSMAIIGPPAKGILWECTALREIRLQAALVVQHILQAEKVKNS
jgi:uncharacterized NAD(P)/FAD-binding protein YdhS